MRSTAPLHWAIYNSTGSSPASGISLIAVCGAVMSEGGNQYPTALPFSASTGSSGITAASGVLTPLISIQPALLYQGLPNRTMIDLKNIDLYDTDASNSVTYCLNGFEY